ncbi:hypothetical protein ES703_72419 [subsurface metagenome]
MSGVDGVFKTAFCNWLFREDYDWATGSHKKAGTDKEIAVIREFLLGNTASVRLSAQEANSAVSMVQIFDDAATSIRDTLASMEKLAEKATKSYCTDKEKASMQKELEGLAKDINDTVNNTKYDGNKLFTAAGQVITRSIGNGRTIALFAKDLSFDVESVDLATDAQGALATIKNALKEADEYTTYVKSQNKFLQDAMAIIEHKMASAAGIDPSSFQTKIMEQLITNISAAISNDTNTSTQIQSNITADEALQLLKDGN